MRLNLLIGVLFGLFLVASFTGATVVTDTSYADFTNAGVTLNNVTVNAGGDVVLSSSGGVAEDLFC